MGNLNFSSVEMSPSISKSLIFSIYYTSFVTQLWKITELYEDWDKSTIALYVFHPKVAKITNQLLLKNCEITKADSEKFEKDERSDLSSKIALKSSPSDIRSQIWNLISHLSNPSYLDSFINVANIVYLSDHIDISQQVLKLWDSNRHTNVELKYARAVSELILGKH